MQLEDRFYTSTEVAEILGVSLRSVYRYLEEDKINAEVKTATGRHRFTRQNIMDFLYPNGTTKKTTEPVTTNSSTPSETVVEKETLTVSNTTEAPETPVEVTEEPTEDVDWLAKFRAAAQRHRDQLQAQTEEEATEEEVEPNPTPTKVEEEVPNVAPTTPTPSLDSLSSLTDVPTEPKKESVVEPVKAIPTEFYYKSSMGGLKELAQYINKAATKSGVAYAFTMNAGLSLHKLIRPFSMLHIYVRQEDKEFFEKALELTQVEKADAQLGIFIDTSTVLTNKKEIHGLSVVADSQLKKDLLALGEVDLANELDEALSL